MLGLAVNPAPALPGKTSSKQVSKTTSPGDTLPNDEKTF